MDTVIQVVSDEPVPPRRLNRVDAARSGDDLPEVPGEGAGPTVRQRRGPGGRPAPVPGGRADRGAAGDAAGARWPSGRGGSRRWPPRTRSGCWRCCSAGSGVRPCGSGGPRNGHGMRRSPPRPKPNDNGTGRTSPEARPTRPAAARAEGPGRGRAAAGEIRAVRLRADHPGGPPGVAGEQRPRHAGLARQHPGRPPRLGVAIRPSPLPFRPAHAQGAHRSTSVRRRSARTARGS